MTMVIDIHFNLKNETDLDAAINTLMNMRGGAVHWGVVELSDTKTPKYEHEMIAEFCQKNMLSYDLCERLINQDIGEVSDLLDLTADDLIKVSGFSQEDVGQIRRALSDHGLRLSGDAGRSDQDESKWQKVGIPEFFNSNGLPSSLATILTARYIETVEHLLQYSEREFIVRIRGIGQAKVDLIKKALADNGLKLRKE